MNAVSGAQYMRAGVIGRGASWRYFGRLAIFLTKYLR